MNFLILLIAAAVLGAAWIGFSRASETASKSGNPDPATTQRRTEIVVALRALAFFLLVDFVVTTLLIFIAAFFIALIAPPNNKPFTDAFGEVVNSVSREQGYLSSLSVGGALVELVGTVIAVVLSQKIVRGQPILALGLRYYKALPLDVLMGLLLGPLLFALIWFSENALGFLLASSGTVGNYDWLALAKWTLVFACVAFSEELMVRGYLLQTINGVWGGATAVVASSLYWGLAHLLNPNSSVISALNVTVAGLLFAYAYVITGSLWLPMALHFSWNFAEGVIFGYPVSGFQVDTSILQPIIEGPKAITGGLFGPEGGLLGLVAIIAGALILYGWSRSRPTPASLKTVDK